MKYSSLLEMKNPVRHFYFSFSYLFFTLQVPTDSSSLTFNLHPFVAKDKIISVFSVDDKSASCLWTMALISLWEVSAKAGQSQIKLYSFYINGPRPKPPPFLGEVAFWFCSRPLKHKPPILSVNRILLKHWFQTAFWIVFSQFNSVLSATELQQS